MSGLTPDTALTLMQVQQSGNAADTSKALRAARQSKDLEAIEAAAKDFEAMFVAEMIKPMFDGIKTDGAFGGGKGEEVFRGMMTQEYGKMLAQSGAIGMTDSVKQQMILMQEQATAQAMNAIEPSGDDTSTPETTTK